MSKDNVVAPTTDDTNAQAGSVQDFASDRIEYRRRWWRSILLFIVPLIVTVAGTYWYYAGGRYVGTDNAYVHADMVPISPQVSGPVEEVHVSENQSVKKGDVLFTIAAEPYRIAVEAAEANLGVVREQLQALKATYLEQQSLLELDRINSDYAQRTYERQFRLAKESAVSEQMLDEAQSILNTSRQKIAHDQQSLQVTLARLGGTVDMPIEKMPEYRQAKAVLDKAQLELDYTRVTAPFDGVVGNRPKPGQYVSPNLKVMSLVATHRLWVEANYKEIDLAYVAPGQSVTIDVDTYPDHQWRGTVESISPATGSEFSILPAQNATGNWVKVVQRIAVRISVDTNDELPPLRAGMSTEVEIDTQRNRTPPRWLEALIDWVMPRAPMHENTLS